MATKRKRTPTIRIYLYTMLTGDTLTRNANKWLWPQGLKILYGYGAPVVVRGGNADHMAKGRSYCVLKLKLIREESLT